MKTTCRGISKGGDRCLARPLRDSDFCFWHDPDHADEAEQARRLGGQRRRREKVTEGAYDLGNMESVAEIRRLVQIAMLDTLALENSVARNRTLLAAGLAFARLKEVGDHEERLAAIEAALGPRLIKDRRR